MARKVSGWPLIAPVEVEGGVANGALIVSSTNGVGGVQTMDKTVQEIYDALISGTPVYYAWTYGGNPTDSYLTLTWLAPITAVYTYADAEVIRIAVNRPVMRGSAISSIHTAMSPSVMTFQANRMDDYPTFYCVEVSTIESSYRSTYFNLNL